MSIRFIRFIYLPTLLSSSMGNVCCGEKEDTKGPALSATSGKENGLAGQESVAYPSTAECVPDDRREEDEKKEALRLAEKISGQGQIRSEYWLSSIKTKLRGLKRIRFFNALDHPVCLWVYDNPEQLVLQEVSAGGEVEPPIPYVELKAKASATYKARGGMPLPVQAVVVPSGVTIPIYVQSKLAYITFAVRDRKPPPFWISDLRILQHQRQVPTNHIFTFRNYHLDALPIGYLPRQPYASSLVSTEDKNKGHIEVIGNETQFDDHDFIFREYYESFSLFYEADDFFPPW